jgi:hypothetical protein
MQSLLVDSEISSDERRIGRDTTWFGRAAFLRVLLASFGLCILGVSCQDVATTWSAEVRSPDGHWLATARTQQWGGPGTAYDATTVYLKPVNTGETPTQVLVFSHQYSTMNLKMEWVSPTHLEVKYGTSARPDDHVSLDFQVVKMSGIDISVQELPDGRRGSR